MDRAEMKGLRRWLSQQPVEAEGRPRFGLEPEAGSSPDNVGAGRYHQTARAR